jgi:hypothetical protein
MADALAGSARLMLVSGVRHLDPQRAVFEAMLAGWIRQQQARGAVAAGLDAEALEPVGWWRAGPAGRGAGSGTARGRGSVIRLATWAWRVASSVVTWVARGSGSSMGLVPRVMVTRPAAVSMASTPSRLMRCGRCPNRRTSSPATAALLHLAGEMPPAILGDLPGLGHIAVQDRSTLAGRAWASYAADRLAPTR